MTMLIMKSNKYSTCAVFFGVEISDPAEVIIVFKNIQRVFDQQSDNITVKKVL